MSEQPEEEETRSVILIQFAEPGSAIFRVDFQGVIPAQVLAAAAYLELRGKNAMIQQENDRMRHEAEQQLTVPKPTILRPGE